MAPMDGHIFIGLLIVSDLFFAIKLNYIMFVVAVGRLFHIYLYS